MMTEQRPQLLVASAGGHLHELSLLADAFRPTVTSSHWVTYGTLDARERLAGEQVTVCHWPTQRDLPRAVRNAALARRLIAELRPSRVVSTGAGVAVPFLTVASRAGIPSYYIESAARVDGPSLSGRLVASLSDAALFTQHASWADGRWHHRGNVFDRFVAQARPAPASDRPLRIAVSLGTHVFPFDRIVAALAAVTRPDDEVFAQLGPSRSAPSHWQVHDRVAPGALEERFRWADVVVCHAGVGLLLTALSQGVVPLVVPRLHRHGEAVDDHQQQIAGSLAARGLAVVADPATLTRRELYPTSRAVARDASSGQGWVLPVADPKLPAPPPRLTRFRRPR